MSASLKTLRWQQEKYSPWQRKIDVFSVATRFFLALGWDKITGNSSEKQQRRHARWLVAQLLELGPTFIKMGQALSTRSDLIPLPYIEALEQLHDRVPPFPSQEAIAVIETELGSSISELFQEFEETPIAAASLGQVHRATLPTGEKVAIKVQRPGLERLLNLDFAVLHRLIRLLQRYFPKVKKYNLEHLYHEFFGLLYQEIDYIHEGKNAERFQSNFRDYPNVVVPRVYWRYTSQRILALEYLPGIKFDDRASLESRNFNPDRLIQTGIVCYLKQLLEDGFFQSDPHPGNMAVNEQGKIIFYDFGTMAEVKSMAKDEMINTFFAVMRKDTDAVVQSLVYMGLIEPLQDMSPIKRLVAFVLEQFREKPIDLRAFEQMSSEVYLMFEKQPFRLPSEMMFVIKSVSTLDGIARALNPQYNLIAASQPFLKELTQSARKGNLIRQTFRQAGELIRDRLDRPSRVELAIQDLQERLDRGEIEFQVKSETSDRALKRINLAVKCLIYTCLSGFSLISGTLLVIGGIANWGIVIFCFSAFWFLILLRSLMQLAVRERLDKFVEK
ncbi:AarF/ABC1/UbiB kinase family protein [Spirulina sp. 06S082]|uniref:ABC1 kinase family protein n=1 Tax=Spirulina sp. 06S082 TaxID=3110248 RepID=UPI002B1FCA51|nr:AarF/ABC1/UbiB kinase family protein [Spirulina sp. 06S082]MEA5467541.1 AarF/ABC1/UbiB kinase family protein [Spirulina sp. 06S082]